MTESELNEIEARANAVTSGPFVVADESYGSSEIWEARDYTGHRLGLFFGASAEDNASLFAAARTDVPKLVAEVRRLRRLIRDAEVSWSERRQCPWCYQQAVDVGTSERINFHSMKCDAFTPEGEVK